MNVKVQLMGGTHDKYQKGDVFEMAADSHWIKDYPLRFKVIPEPVVEEQKTITAPAAETAQTTEKPSVSEQSHQSEQTSAPAAEVKSDTVPAPATTAKPKPSRASRRKD